MNLNKVSETSSTITLGWTPPTNVQYYLFYADDQLVSNSPSVDKNGNVKKQIKFNKSGNPFEVVAVIRVNGVMSFDVGKYDLNPSPPPGDTQSPTAPTNLRTTSVDQTNVSLAWNPSTDNVGVVKYNVYRNNVKIGEGPGSSGGAQDAWTDNGLTCGTSYVYAVDSEDAAGNKSVKATLTVMTVACDTPPPPPPSGTMTPTQFQSAAVSGATIENQTVTGSVNITNSNVTAKNCVFQGTVDLANGTVLDGCKAKGFYAFGKTGWSLLNSQFDGQGSVSQNLIWDQPAGQGNKNWKISNCTFTNFYKAGDSTVHSEALYIGGWSDGGVVENCHFMDNGTTGHIFFTWFGTQASTSGYPRNICVRGNTFENNDSKVFHYFDIDWRTEIPYPAANIKINPNNTFDKGSSRPEFSGAC